MSIEDKVMGNDVIHTAYSQNKSASSEDAFTLSEIWDILVNSNIWLVDGINPFDELVKTVRLNKLNKTKFKKLFDADSDF